MNNDNTSKCTATARVNKQPQHKQIYSRSKYLESDQQSHEVLPEQLDVSPEESEIEKWAIVVEQIKHDLYPITNTQTGSDHSLAGYSHTSLIMSEFSYALIVRGFSQEVAAIANCR